MQDVAAYTALFPFTLEAEFDGRGYMQSGVEIPNNEVRVFRNWTWPQETVDALFGRTYTMLVPEYVEMIPTATLDAAKGGPRVEVTRGVTVTTPVHVRTAHGARSLHGLQSVINIARASLGLEPMNIQEISLSPMDDPYGWCTKPDQLPLEVRKCRAQWYKNPPNIGYRSRPSSGPHSHIVNADELNVWIQRVGNGTSRPLQSTDYDGLEERNWSTSVAQMQRWVERNRLPPMDTPPVCPGHTSRHLDYRYGGSEAQAR